MVDTFEEAVFELWYWQHGTGPTNFHSKLYDLISSADMSNRMRLIEVYPLEVGAFEAWQASDDETAFFRTFKAVT